MALPKTDSTYYDTSHIRIIQPPIHIEKQIFSDPALHYNREKAKDIGWLDRFINWLLESLFGKADPDTVNITSRIIFWVIVLGVLGIIIRILLRSEFSGFLQGNSKARKFNFTDVEEDISSINFAERIQTAIDQKDYRLAVRWHYLEILHLLHQKQLINWQSFKTNIDYYNELGKTTYQKSFKELSYIYEFAWYGKYDIDLNKFNNLKQEFEQFKSALQ
ncbi:MAG: hypothetical protein JST26_03865 [Bacteroidetes bacterium]|nr:hypothetical protein [Bacteroidota bacterium]